MERNSFKEYSVLAMVSKEEQRPMKACYNFFHLDRVIAWLNEVATVAHNNTSRRLGKTSETISDSVECSTGLSERFESSAAWM